MVSTEYLSGRRKWFRPQAVILSDVRFIVNNGGFIPPTDADEGIDFIILTDHNRGPIDMSPVRIESRKRMVDATSRSRHTADKARVSTSWEMLPGRVAAQKAVFDTNTGRIVSGGEVYVADDASAALDMRQWYDTHPGPFHVYLSYDMGPGYSDVQYTDHKFMYFDSFSATLSKRGLYDFWEISMSLEEV